MVELTRKSVLFLKAEVTPGTPVLPTVATDAVALQDGFTLEPAFEQLTNDEVKSSIGAAAPILGIEEPNLSMDHYIRHSGVEAQAPNFDLLLHSSIGGKKIRATERDVVSATAGTASADATITVDTGEGAEWERGDTALIKDLVNGFSLAPIKSVSGDVLTLGFNLANAPASGVNLGRNVLYKPSDNSSVAELSPTFTASEFRGNGGAIEVIAGNRVESMDMNIEAGQLVGAAFTTIGTEFFFNALEVTAANNKLDFTDAIGPKVATIANKLYKDPIALGDAIKAALDAIGVDVFTATYDSLLGKYTITSDGATFELDAATGPNVANGIFALIGFAAADLTGATTYTSDGTITLTAPFSPVFDSASPLVAKNNTFLIGSNSDITCFSLRTMTIGLSNTIENVLDVCAASGVSEKAQTERNITVDIVANLPKFDADKFKRFRNNDTTSFLFSFGEKDGAGNLLPGKSVSVYSPTAKISSFSLGDDAGIVTLEMTLIPFVNDAGEGEFFLNFL